MHSTKAYEIRLAKKEDLGAVASLCLDRAGEFDFDFFPEPDKDKIAETVVSNWRSAPCFVVDHEVDGIIGFCGLTIDTFWWSKEPLLCDYMVFVMQRFRDYDIVKELYEEAKDFADFHGLALHLHYICNERMDARLRLMRRLGFSHQGYLLSYKGE